jgi:hypothetical protein
MWARLAKTAHDQGGWCIRTLNPRISVPKEQRIARPTDQPEKPSAGGLGRLPRRSFARLSRPGGLSPSRRCVALAEAAGAFRRGGRFRGRTGRPRAVAHVRPGGRGNWQRSGTAICRRASARARLLARNMLPTALPVCRINLPMRAAEAR